jgi:hypothetical protein
LVETALARRAAEVVFRASSRLHLARFDQSAPARCQVRILLGLLHQAQRTPFGREHDFRRIRTVTDYRRLVPIAESPRGAGLPAALHASHRAGLRTTLALAGHARPRAPLFAGPLLLLHEEASGMRVPALVRPYTLAAGAADPAAVARRCAAEAVTCLAGPAERLVSLLEQLRALTGKGAGEVWPGLTTVLYSSASAGTTQELRAALGPGVRMLEMVWGPEGMLAVEDPRYGCLRLLHDHGLYFEFLPLPSLALQACGPSLARRACGPSLTRRACGPSLTRRANSSGEALRLGLDEAEVGVPYELALTSPAGWWSCRTGRTLCLERRDPPLVRFLQTPVPAAAVHEAARPRGDKAALTFPVQPPHRQSAGTAAALPESFAHSPWSALAGRG